ncbi:MAG TPA: hydroxymethylbilane synthase [Actinobacteria bacterium]|nr:hydroxymethylbilane synthase [Actinomycetota bacterium]
MTADKAIIIGTRGSKLALWQANYIQAMLEEKANVKSELKIIKTKGDKILDVALSKLGDKGLFVKEIENALLDESVDIAVHSMKDLPTELPEGLEIMASPPREDNRDAFVSLEYNSVDELEKGAVVGSSSLRRKAQLLAMRSDVEVKEIRGNVDTRLKKLESGEYQAILMAYAGLKRLGFTEHIKQIFEQSEMLPAVGQGAIAIEARSDDEDVRQALNKLNDEKTLLVVRAERALMKELEGGCQVPIGANAQVENGTIHIDALVASINGEKIVKDEASGSEEQPEKVGIQVADKLRAKGAEEILDKIREENPLN